MSNQQTLQKLITPHSTLNNVKGLTKNFEDQIFEIQMNKYYSQPPQNRGRGTQALAATLITGCTQAELAYGIHVGRNGEDTIHAFLPLSTKTEQRADGTWYRHLTIHNAKRSVAGRFLCEYLQVEKQTQRIQLSAKRQNEILNSVEAEYKLTLGKKGSNIRITHPLFRNLLFSQMFHCGYRPSEMIEILGLKNKYSLKNYTPDVPHQSVSKGFIQFVDNQLVKE